MKAAPLMFIALPLILLLWAVQAQQQPQGLAPAVTGRVLAGPLGELSGMVQSRRHAGTFWAHNDSGDSARIFAFDAQGRAILPTYSALSQYGDLAEAGKTQWQGFEVLYATNVDWEDIAIDEHYLYLADLGNNRNDRRDLAIYAISEIDPTASTRSAVVQKYPVVYPQQSVYPDPSWDLDSESLFVADNNLYVISKHRSSSPLHGLEPGANLYRLDSRYTDRDNVLTLVDSNPDLRAATGADLAPDGQTLAVVSYTDLWLFQRPLDGSDQWLSAPAIRIPLERRTLRQVEAVAWIDASTLLLGNEQRELFRLTMDTLTP